MFTKKVLFKSLAIAGLVAATGASQAAITVYTSLSAFTAAVLTSGTDTFQGFSVSGSTAGPINRSAGSFSYSANTDPGEIFYGAGTTENPSLSTNTANDSILFNLADSGANAFGGNFFGSDMNGALVIGDMTISVTDANGTTTRTVMGVTSSSFLGFVSSTGAITAATVLAIQPLTGFMWPTVDNLVLAAVPEPSTYAMLLAGLGLVGFMARRRS
jgi:hypothetical protein